MTRQAPFVIFALPRSRTAWLAHFLSYDGNWCGHDIGIECCSVGDFAIPFDKGMIGTVETGAMGAHRRIRDMMPKCKFIVIKRPVWQVLQSLLRIGIDCPAEEMLKRDEWLDGIAADKDTLTVKFDDLKDETKIKQLFQHCLGRPWDPEWWNTLRQINIQVDIGARVAQLQRRGPALAELKREAWLNEASQGHA